MDSTRRSFFTAFGVAIASVFLGSSAPVVPPMLIGHRIDNAGLLRMFKDEQVDCWTLADRLKIPALHDSLRAGHRPRMANDGRTLIFTKV